MQITTWSYVVPENKCNNSVRKENFSSIFTYEKLLATSPPTPSTYSQIFSVRKSAKEI